MSEFLSAEFVERHIVSLPNQLIPEPWNLERHGVFYTLDLKMCQLKTFDFDFRWGDDSVPAPRLSSVLETPSKIVRLDVSLNELTSLSHDGLLPFRNLRALDASLNQLKYFQGVEVLRNLYSLNLSHNNLRNVDGLLQSQSLGELNLSNNNISDISAIPSLVNLRVFNISNNKLENLEGVSSFPRLEDINASNNLLRELVPLTSCLQLRVVTASNNRVKDLDSVLRLVSQQRHMQVLNLSYFRAMERDRTYQSDILRAANLMTLDNVSVRPMPPEAEDRQRHAGNMNTLQGAAKQAFDERMRVAKDRMEENISFLQRRILSIQNEYKEFEAKLKADLEACLRYLSSLSDAELASGGRTTIGATLPPGQSFYEPPDADTYRSRGTRNDRVADSKADYSNVRETDELLRCAFKELAKQKDKSMHI
ncbi:uncharacterized protein LOC101861384 [Aplysia californica]|uniref:Uncharacterized protein LOC101861384 n=1 Tax=Aplysia californica TaxID=6500 RepID=A0ABM0K0H2_APLCA|nr:uncharacterized protein LOC101861384 [Aplysia californica]